MSRALEVACYRFNGAAAEMPRSDRRSISNKDNSLCHELRAAVDLELGSSSMTHFVSVELSEHSDVRVSERWPGFGDHLVARGTRCDNDVRVANELASWLGVIGEERLTV